MALVFTKKLQCWKTTSQNNPFKKAGKNLMYIGINLIKKVEGLYEENYRTLENREENINDGKGSESTSII